MEDVATSIAAWRRNRYRGNPAWRVSNLPDSVRSERGVLAATVAKLPTYFDGHLSRYSSVSYSAWTGSDRSGPNQSRPTRGRDALCSNVTTIPHQNAGSAFARFWEASHPNAGFPF
jgi:hypothetical protein